MEFGFWFRFSCFWDSDVGFGSSQELFSGFGSRVSGTSSRGRVEGSGIRVWGRGLASEIGTELISDFGIPALNFGFQVSGFGSQVSDFGFRVSGFRFRVVG